MSANIPRPQSFRVRTLSTVRLRPHSVRGHSGDMTRGSLFDNVANILTVTPQGPSCSRTEKAERDTSGTVEALLLETDRVSSRKPDNFEILVPLRLGFKAEPVPKDVGMAILCDRVLSHGYLPEGLSETNSGTIYRFKIISHKA